MHNEEDRLKEIIEKLKQSSSLKNDEILEAVAHLRTLSQNDGKISTVVDFLSELPISIIPHFISSSFLILDENTKTEFIVHLLKNAKIVKNNACYGINRCLTFANELLRMGSDQEHSRILLILKYWAAAAPYLSEKGHKNGEALYKYCIHQGSAGILSLDYSSWEQIDLRLFYTFLESAMVHCSDQKQSQVYFSFLERYQLPKSRLPAQQELAQNESTAIISHKPQLNGAMVSKDLAENPGPIPQEKNKLNNLANALIAEADKIVEDKKTLQRQLASSEEHTVAIEKEKDLLQNRLRQLMESNRSLGMELHLAQSKLEEAYEKINNLDARLQQSFSADRLLQNQELAILKNELRKMLVSDYNAFRQLSLKSTEEYALYYEGLVEIIESIFTALKRKDIVFDS